MALYQNTVNIVGAAAIGLLLGHGGYAGQLHPSLEFLLRAEHAHDQGPPLIAATGLIAAAGSWSLTHAYRVAEVNAWLGAVRIQFDHPGAVLGIL